MILEGRVSVDGEIVKQLGVKLDPVKSLVCIDGKQIKPQDISVYLALHKPRGVLTTVFDPFKRPTVMALVKDAPGRIYPVGRLDMDSEGLLLFTSDGELANRLIHPRHKVEKTYRVTVSGCPGGHDLDLLRSGVEIDGRMTLPCRIRGLEYNGRSSLLEVVLKEGRKRQIRAMFDRIGLRVTRLVRIRIGPIELGGLLPGRWRMLKENEVSELKTALGLSTSGI
jgi:pseudouridine synthase